MERAATAAYTHAGAVAWAMKLPPAERYNLVRDLQQVDSKRSGLS
jgi:hypothetical protein